MWVGSRPCLVALKRNYMQIEENSGLSWMLICFRRTNLSMDPSALRFFTLWKRNSWLGFCSFMMRFLPLMTARICLF